jgi:hypothetical protein
MKESLKVLWEKRPLTVILLAGIFFRLLAVIFSKGFGMHDDHFLIVESSQSWVDGYDYDNWLPSSGAKHPDGHSLFYPGLHFLLFTYLKWRGLIDPQGKMYIVRALNAAWSLLTIAFGFRIAKHYAGLKVAKQAGLMLSILWFMPMLCVRDLVEMFCIPALMVSTWMLVDPARKDRMKAYIIAGIFAGIAFNTRFQSSLFIAPLGLVVLIERKWKPFLMFCIGVFIAVFPVQGLMDIYIWKKPFAEFFKYTSINSNNYNDFAHGPWYNYLLLIGGIVLPPIGLFCLFGYFCSWKKYALLFWPSFVFLAFHSSFPNKQERFILPIIPFVIVLGLIGWSEFTAKSKFWQNRPKLMNYFWGFFWTLNCIALPVISTMYSKKSRVEAMTFLGHQKDLHGLMIEQSYENDFLMPPLFYIGKWQIHVEGITLNHNLVDAYVGYHADPRDWAHPNYVVFFGKNKIAERVEAFKKVFPHTDSVTTKYPGLVDNILEWLNPLNRNMTAYIYHFTEDDMHLPDGVVAPTAYHPSGN